MAGSSASCDSSSVRSRHLCGPRPPGSDDGPQHDRRRGSASGGDDERRVLAGDDVDPQPRALVAGARRRAARSASASGSGSAVERAQAARRAARGGRRGRCGSPSATSTRLVQPGRRIGPRHGPRARGARRAAGLAPPRRRRARRAARRSRRAAAPPSPPPRAPRRRPRESATIPPPAPSQMRVAADLERADRDAQLEPGERAREADRAGVGLAAGRLQLGDHVERGELRRAGDRAGRERRAQQVGVADAVAQLALDLGDHVPDARVRADLGERGRRARVPGRQTRPRSLRTRSTIITFSARSFSDAASSARPVAPGRVPLIGALRTVAAACG